MAKVWFESKEVKCPFYLHERQQIICCESVIPDTVAQIAYPHINKQREHQQKFCYDLNNYDKCPHYIAVMKRYEDEGEE